MQLSKIVAMVNKYKTVNAVKEAMEICHGAEFDLLGQTIEVMQKPKTQAFKLENEKYWNISTIKSLKAQILGLESDLEEIEAALQLVELPAPEALTADEALYTHPVHAPLAERQRILAKAQAYVKVCPNSPEHLALIQTFTRAMK